MLVPPVVASRVGTFARESPGEQLVRAHVAAVVLSTATPAPVIAPVVRTRRRGPGLVPVPVHR